MFNLRDDVWLLLSHLDVVHMQFLDSYCKTRIFCVPFISRISRPWRIRENNGPRIFEYFHMH